MSTYLEQLLIPDLSFSSQGFLPFRLLLLLNKPTMRILLSLHNPQAHAVKTLKRIINKGLLITTCHKFYGRWREFKFGINIRDPQYSLLDFH